MNVPLLDLCGHGLFRSTFYANIPGGTPLMAEPELAIHVISGIASIKKIAIMLSGST